MTSDMLTDVDHSSDITNMDGRGSGVVPSMTSAGLVGLELRPGKMMEDDGRCVAWSKRCGLVETHEPHDSFMYRSLREVFGSDVFLLF